MAKYIEGKLVTKAKGTVTASAKIRTNYSGYHLRAAHDLAKLCLKIEEKYKGKQLSDSMMFKHRAYVTNSLFSSVAFLESLINEFFVDVVANSKNVTKLGSTNIDLLKFMWELDEPTVSRMRILNKYQLALRIVKKTGFDKSRNAYQNTANLIALRNALTHYKPEWVGTDDVSEKTISAGLKSKFGSKTFSLNPFASPNDAYFPKKCLSYGCAKWAIITGVQFADEFFTRLGLPAPYNHLRSALKLK